MTPRDVLVTDGQASTATYPTWADAAFVRDTFAPDADIEPVESDGC